LERAAKRAGGRLVTNQVEFHPLIDQRPLEKVARDNDMKLTAYGALARGECLKVPAIKHIAERRGVSAAEVILNWALAQDVYVLTRSNKPDHIRASWNVQKLKPSTDEVGEISSLREGNRSFTIRRTLSRRDFLRFSLF
jgi:2,5-diketo-D-gluconate reductase B